MKSKQLEEALEIARQHIFETQDIAGDTVEKYWEQFSFDKSTLEFLAKKGFLTLLTADLRAPSKPKYTRTYEVTTRPKTPIEQTVFGGSGHGGVSTYKHRPILSVKPSKVLMNVVDQILSNVALEGASGRRVLLRDFTIADCNHYDKTQSLIADGIQRKRLVVMNIRARLKHFGASRVSELPPREQTFISREWKNAEKGMEAEAFAATVGK